MEAVCVQPFDGRLSGFVGLASLDAFEAVVEGVGVSAAAGELELATGLTLPVEIPSVQLDLKISLWERNAGK